MTPNWKDEKSYEYTASLSPIGWAWEFARRNPEYREAFKKYQEIVKALQDELGDKWKFSEKAKRPDPPKEPGEHEKMWQIRADKEGKRARLIPLDQAMGLPFHLNGMYDPDKMVDQGVEFLPVSKFPKIVTDPDQISAYIKSAPDCEDDQDGYYDILFDPKLAVMIIDLSVSLEKQIPHIKELIAGARKLRGLNKPQAPSVQLEAWTRYLRILDAKKNAISDDEIANTLWLYICPNEDPITSLTNAYKSAREWIKNKRYVRFLKMPI